MKAFLALFALVAVAAAQRNNVDPRTAAILAEARYLSGDGSFGSAYVQEDGTDFKEETQADGTRKGQYSYVDPNGKKITVQYTAGKNGFQVTGDHLPKAPAPLPVPAPQAPVPQYNPQPQYNSIQQQPQQYQPQQQQRQQANQGNQFSYSFGTDNNNQQYNNPQQYNNNFQPQQFVQTTTTPVPTRFFPPGKLNLNRSPDGYQYSFSSQ